jgi:predicted PurR-regulated permease PerM
LDTWNRAAQIGMIVAGLVLGLAALNAAEAIFAPLTLALVVGIVLSPISDFWENRGFPPALGALTSLFLTMTVFGLLILMIQPVVAELLAAAPKVWADMQDTVDLIKGFLRGLAKVSEGMSSAVATDANAAPAAPAQGGVAMPGISEALMIAPSVLGQIMVFAGGLFFFLLTRNEIYTWIASLVTGRGRRVKTGRRLRDAERVVSRYFVTIALVNGGLGLATGIALQILGLPGAMFWGVVAGVMNFIVYLGPAMVSVGLLFAGIAAFDGVHALLPALIFVGLNGLEGQFVTPAFLARQLAVNPLLIFVALLLGIWLWGALGGFVAIPLMVWILVFADMLETVSETPPVAQAA